MKKFRLQFTNPYVRNKFILCFVVAIIATIVGFITALSFRQPILALTALLFVGYFVIEACEIAANDKAGRYVVVPAVLKEKSSMRVLAGMPSKSVGTKSVVFRFAPVDEQGNVIDEAGKKDMYLTLSEKQSAVYGVGFEGRIHNLLFCKNETQPFDTSTLRGIYYD